MTIKKKRAHKFYNHQGENDLDTLHIKVLTFRETLERSSLSQLVLGLETVKPTGINQIIRKLCDALESANQKPPQQTGMLMLSDRLLDHCDWSITKEILDYSLTAERGRHRQAWLLREERLCTHCTHQEVETELHFLTTCQLYPDIRQKLPTDYNRCKGLWKHGWLEKPPYLLGEIQHRANTAARFSKSLKQHNHHEDCVPALTMCTGLYIWN